MTARFLVGDVFDRMAELEPGSVDLVMTSPPFLALRSYLPPDHPDKVREIGSEPTPAAFLDTMLDVVDACARVLAPHGSICFEFGDTYSGSGGAGGDYNEGGLRDGQAVFSGSAARRAKNGTGDNDRPARAVRDGWPLAKSLCFIPELFGASLAYGRNLLRPEHDIDPWRVRNFVAWVRPNPPVGALGDKVRPGTSYLTWACKSATRWFDLDAVRVPASSNSTLGDSGVGDGRYDLPSQQRDGNWNTLAAMNGDPAAGAPPLDWWSISPQGYEGSHYAVFPPELCRIPIEASCPRRVCRTCGTPSRRLVVREQADTGRTTNGPQSIDRKWIEGGSPGYATRTESRSTTTGWTTCTCPGADGIRIDGYHDGHGWRPGVVLDPFAGTGTTLQVAQGLSRDAIGIDLDARNADLARDRLGMFVEIDEPAGAA